MYTGAPQIVTDVGAYRDFLNSSVAEFIPANGKFYFSGGMPHGFSSPTFATEDVTRAMESMVQDMDAKRKAVQSYPYPSWSRICDAWLEDVLTESRRSGIHRICTGDVICPRQEGDFHPQMQDRQTLLWCQGQS